MLLGPKCNVLSDRFGGHAVDPRLQVAFEVFPRLEGLLSFTPWECTGDRSVPSSDNMVISSATLVITFISVQSPIRIIRTFKRHKFVLLLMLIPSLRIAELLVATLPINVHI